MKTVEEYAVRIPAGGVTLDGDLRIPDDAKGIILFAHGSGSSRHSPRNRFVAQELNRSGMATLLIDLLTHEEERMDASGGRLRFDIDLLTGRLGQATDWATQQQKNTRHLPIGYFGASTGAGAALMAAAAWPDLIAAVVSRGGRPDLAGKALASVRAPTLLIVGGDDIPVIELNEQAMAQLTCHKKLEIVPHATHLFEEPGTLKQVAQLACEWFAHYLGSRVE